MKDVVLFVWNIWLNIVIIDNRINFLKVGKNVKLNGLLCDLMIHDLCKTSSLSSQINSHYVV